MKKFVMSFLASDQLYAPYLDISGDLITPLLFCGHAGVKICMLCYCKVNEAQCIFLNFILSYFCMNAASIHYAGSVI